MVIPLNHITRLKKIMKTIYTLSVFPYDALDGLIYSLAALVLRSPVRRSFKFVLILLFFFDVRSDLLLMADFVG